MLVQPKPACTGIVTNRQTSTPADRAVYLGLHSRRMFYWTKHVTCRAKSQATVVIHPFYLQSKVGSATYRVRQQHRQCAGCSTTSWLKCRWRQGSSAAVRYMLGSTPLPQAAALTADAGALHGRLQAHALQGQHWRWQRQPQAPRARQRAQQLLRMAQSWPRRSLQPRQLSPGWQALTGGGGGACRRRPWCRGGPLRSRPS